MKFEEVLPAYRAGKIITVPSCYNTIITWYFNKNEPGHAIIFRKESILSDKWQIEPDKCSHCNGTGREPEKETRCPFYCDGCSLTRPNEKIQCVRKAGHSNQPASCTCNLNMSMK